MSISSRGGNQNYSTQQKRRVKPRTTNTGKFFIPKNKQQFKLCLQRMSLKFLDVAFSIADKSMYLLGPILITLASVLIVGLTYVYFMVILPMMAGTNWVYTTDDWNQYWKERGYESDTGTHYLERPNTDIENEEQSAQQPNDVGSESVSKYASTVLALSTPTGILNTLLVSFFLVNILYNYYQCVVTSNAGPRYDVVVRELAQVTNFHYPRNEEELVQCKKDFEKKIYEKAKKKRDQMMAATDAANAKYYAKKMQEQQQQQQQQQAQTTTSANGANATRNGGDEESQLSTPLMATPTPIEKPKPTTLPKIHNWMLLSPIEWGYCRWSSQPKPPRSHYDHVTKALVLNMDHYCPWMFNCVGYFNYRYFFNFLWFVATALVYGTAICFPAFMKLNTHEYRSQLRASGGFQKPLKDIVVKHIRENAYIPTPSERTPVALGFMLCLCLGLAVMCLGGFHLYLILSAQTTIEFHGNFAKRRKGGWKNPYSAGSWKRNWEIVYGTRFWSQKHTTGVYIQDIDQYRYRGCWGILMAMMPSSREPEFLPFPIDGKLIRRVKYGLTEEVESETDLEMGSAEEVSDGSVSPPSEDFVMKPKDNDTGLVDRARSNRLSKGRIV